MGTANGYYYNINGFFYGKEGSSTIIKLCTGIKLNKIIKDNKTINQILYLNPVETNIEFDDLIEVAATTYGESSVGREGVNDNDFKWEARALANCIFNYKNKRNHDQPNGYIPEISQIATDMRAYAQGKPNYRALVSKSLNPLSMNNTKMQIHIEAAILATLRDKIINKLIPAQILLALTPYLPLILIDYSSGAILWDGVDLKTNPKHEKINDGYLVKDESHNVLKVQSKKVNKCLYIHDVNNPKFREMKCYNYKYETTCGYAKSMFVKLNEEYENANIHSRREIKNGTYVLNKWW